MSEKLVPAVDRWAFTDPATLTPAQRVLSAIQSVGDRRSNVADMLRNASAALVDGNFPAAGVWLGQAVALLDEIERATYRAEQVLHHEFGDPVQPPQDTARPSPPAQRGSV